MSKLVKLGQNLIRAELIKAITFDKTLSRKSKFVTDIEDSAEAKYPLLSNSNNRDKYIYKSITIVYLQNDENFTFEEVISRDTYFDHFDEYIESIQKEINDALKPQNNSHRTIKQTIRKLNT